MTILSYGRQSESRRPLSLGSRIEASDGLWRRVRLFVTGDDESLAAVRAVDFDLGPTFLERVRRVDASRDPVPSELGIVVDAYGAFLASATVTMADEQTAVLSHAVAVPPVLDAPDDAGIVSGGPGRRRIPAVAPWAGMLLELTLGGVLLVLIGVVIVLWPAGPGRGLSWTTAIPLEWRMVLLAAAAGGAGAVLRAAGSLVAHPETHTLTAAWVRRYLLQALPGMAVATIAYLVVRGALFTPGTSADVVSPAGIVALALAAGLNANRVTARLQTLAEWMFGSLLAQPATDVEVDDTMTTDTGPDGKSPPPSREAQHAADVATAQAILRGAEAPAKDIYALAERLKDQNEFGYSRRLYGRIRQQGRYGDVSKSPVKVGQRHALCTYKDPDLPAADRFTRALEILDEVDLLDQRPPEKQETLGLRGAIYKRMWQVSGQAADLERALGYYLQGYDMGAETDQGYTGINAAFVLDVLAREDAEEARKSGSTALEAEQRWKRAREIRERLVTLLPRIVAEPANRWLETEWWFYTTRAEAHFGLGQYDEALASLRSYNDAVGLGHHRAPLERIAPWEFESTITQLAVLAQLQADLADLLGETSTWKERSSVPAGELRERARQTLREYLGELAPAVDRAFTGKLGLGLSGGGFRASLFHLGVLAYLAERDVLRRIEVLSCVSGGSIVGAHYYLEVKRLLERKTDREVTRDDYVALVHQVERDFLAGVETNIRSRVFSSVWSNVRAFFQPSYTTTRRLGELYEAELYARVPDGRGDQPRYLPDLFVRPAGEGAGFKPKYDNWRREAKVPVLVLNATTLNSGHNWQFTASWMGEPPSTLDPQIEGNYRLRRMYYREAPRLADKWRVWFRRPFAPPNYQRLRLGHAVAASSCVPGLFEPLVLPDLYDGKVVRLVDGGVYDNQGVASLLEQDCTVMIVSDASGQMASLDAPSGSRLGVPLRSFSVSMARVRQAQYRELAARRRTGLLKGLMFLHLKKDLDADPVDWRECQDPHEASDAARPAARRGVLTHYGVQKSVQRLLSALRTDLDSFTELEAFALMTTGYRQAEADFGQLRTLAAAPVSRHPWRFLQVEELLKPGPGFDEVTRQLDVGSASAGKVWRLWWPLTVVGAAIALAALLGIVRLFVVYQDVTLLTVRSVGLFILVTAATALAPHLVHLLRYRQRLRSLGLRSLLGAVAAIGFKIHLAVFDPIFVRLGRVTRLLAMRRGAGA